MVKEGQLEARERLLAEMEERARTRAEVAEAEGGYVGSEVDCYAPVLVRCGVVLCHLTLHRTAVRRQFRTKARLG